IFIADMLKRSFVIAFFILTLAWTIILIFSGAYKSGYRFIDDHSILAITDNINQKGFWKALADTWQNDLQIRFRPLYILDIVILSYLFGVNWQMWAIHHFFFAIIVSFLVLLFLSKVTKDIVISTLLAILFLVGEQSEIFWRNLPNERLGVFFLVLALLSWLYKYRWLATFFFCCSSLCKESFLIMLPSFFLFTYFQKYPQLFNRKSLQSFLKENIIWTTFLLLFFIACISVILFYVGTHISYAGIKIDNQFALSTLGLLKYGEMNLKGYVTQFFLNITTLDKFTILSLIISILLIISNPYSNINKNFYYNSLLIFLVMWLPQYLIYSRSGISNRYWITYSIPYLFLILSFYQSLNVSLSRKIYKILLIIFAINSFFEAVRGVSFYKKEGIETVGIVETISKAIENYEKYEKKEILIVADGADNREAISALETYLKSKNANLRISFFLTFNSKYYAASDLNEGASQALKDKMITEQEISNKKLIFVFKQVIKLSPRMICKFTDSYKVIKDFEYGTLYEKVK
ncbi:MAG: hypothetical protein NZM44_06760, partial [Candidatus Calescibacterium sp.]|nr:hypothetical protein [Candidatus Calescibacterium sp.]